MITEASFIDFKCPHCGEVVSFPQENAGRPEACPICTESFIVPDDGSEVGWQIPLPITTARLVLRRLAGQDWRDLLELMADEEFFRYREGMPLEEDAVLHWLERDVHVKLTTPDQTLYLGITLQDGGKLIGYIGLNFPEPHRLQATFSIGLNQKFHRQGLGLEALVGLLTFCFEGLKLHRVSASCDSLNAAGIRLLEKAGMRREGEFRKHRLLHDRWADSMWYALLDEEFSKAANNAQPAS
jgi:[ribosomal protein S5]-alanine N-acetyltransferase